MENEKRHIWILIAIALVFCAVLIGYNLFLCEKEPQAIVIETDIARIRYRTIFWEKAILYQRLKVKY